MMCPNCKGKNHKVSNTRDLEKGGIGRTRECEDCFTRWRTTEQIIINTIDIPGQKIETVPAERCWVECVNCLNRALRTHNASKKKNWGRYNPDSDPSPWGWCSCGGKMERKKKGEAV